MSDLIDKSQLCESERIRFLGRVQSHGALIAFDLESSKIRQVSENVAKFVGQDPGELLETSFFDLVPESIIPTIRAALESPAYLYDNPIRLSLQCSGEIREFNAVAHFSSELIVVEIEELEKGNASPSTGVDSYFRLVSETLSAIKADHSVNDISQLIASDLRGFTGFDRVMVYRFDQEFNGEVIAEDHAEGLTPFLGLHYPASDIPPQARELYRTSWLRIIRDVRDEGSPLVSADNEAEPIDLAHATLRSVSPIHCQYLINMGVAASMSISLLTPTGELWGLIACHHYSGPKHLPYGARAACTHYALILSSRLTDRELTLMDREESLRRKNLPEAIRVLFSRDEFQDDLATNGNCFLELLDADGIAMVEDDWVEVVGNTPQRKEICTILDHLPSEAMDDAITTFDSLQKLGLPPRNDKSAGLMRIRIGAQWQILAFRDEFIREINWGGNPDEPMTVSDDGKLNPRASFESFQKTIRGRCREWTEVDKAIAAEFRNSLAAFVINRNTKLKELNKELAGRNSEIQQFAYSVSHDLKSPLVTVNGYVTAIEEDLESGDLEEVKFAIGKVRNAVNSMGSLIEDLLYFSRIGKHDDLPVEIDVTSVLETLREQILVQPEQENLKIVLPKNPTPITGMERDISRIFQNLLENAVKYMPADQPDPKIEIRCHSTRRNVVYEIVDNGAGIDPRYHSRIFRLFERIDLSKPGTGVGLATVSKVMEQHQGRVELESTPGEGSNFQLYFPRPANSRPS